MNSETQPTTLRVAISQPLMHWHGDDNTALIVRALAQAAERGAQLCVFPELAVTGFHRQIAAMAQPPLVAAWLQRIQEACAAHAISASVGAPRFDADGRIYNSQLFIDASGALLGAVDKVGLTEPEATFFARGQSRPHFLLHGRRCSAVICREVEDFDDVCVSLAQTSPQILAWPGLMSPDPSLPPTQPPRHVQHAQRLARQLGAFVVQANWANVLNYPERSPDVGHSVVIGPDGALLFTLPPAQPGVAVFDLGGASFDWVDPEAPPPAARRSAVDVTP